jgi:prepilin-type N-terminal cleavage/methylation domain-containing protein
VTNKNGFTLIELLIVISVIGAMAAITLNVINGGRQKAVAKDATTKANLEKVCASLKAYEQGESGFPEEGDNNNPLDDSAATNATAKVYLSVWPANFIYNYDAPTKGFSVHVVKSVDDNIYKCGSAWRTVQECLSTTPEEDIDQCNPLP